MPYRSSGQSIPAIGTDVPSLVLDTSAYSWLRSGDHQVMELIAQAEVVLLPTIVLGELEAGFELGGRSRENRVVLGEFLAEPWVGVQAVTQDVARRYGRIFADLRRAGTPIPLNDVWIAAITQQCSGHLLTYDGHFRSIGGLEVTVLGA